MEKNGGMQIRTVERGVHATNVNQEADHGHALRSIAITKQLVSEDLAGLAAPGHGIDVQVGEALLADLVGLVAVGEDLLLVVEDGLEEVVLDVLAPERLAVLLFEMADLADDVGTVLGGGIVACALLAARLTLGRFGGRCRHLGVLVLGGGRHEGFFDARGRTGIDVGHDGGGGSHWEWLKPREWRSLFFG